MRTALIILQAAILTFVAVIGAHGDSTAARKCSVSENPMEQHCDP